jgi:S1-C subfamily serine protease
MILVLHDQQEMRTGLRLVEAHLANAVMRVERGSLQRDSRTLHQLRDFENRLVRCHDVERILEVRNQTVTLEIGSGHGSGVVLRNDYVLTARHCADGMVPVVKTLVGERFQVESVWLSDKHDIAILHVPGIKGTSLRPTDPCTVSPMDEIFVIGTPLDLMTEGSVTAGYVCNTNGIDWSHWQDVWLVTAVTANGNSGGPVITRDGRLVGILVGGPSSVDASSVIEPVHHIVEAVAEYERARHENP